MAVKRHFTSENERYYGNLCLDVRKIRARAGVASEKKQQESVFNRKILWRIDPLLSGDSVNSGRYWVTPATCTDATIEERCFLWSAVRPSLCNGAVNTPLTTIDALFSAWSVPRGYLED
jgi:hypothetical protein